MTPSAAARAAAIATLVLGAGGALAVALLRAQAPPEGPVPVAWDRQPCARCRMLVSEPRFAAQIHTGDGVVLHFDDPGCLLLYEEETESAARATWFHHVREDRWVPGEQAVFVPIAPTPMGYGLGAMARGEVDGALSREAARRHVRAREAARRPETARVPATPPGGAGA